MGRRMSVTPSWAMIDPSVSSTIECTTDCGCTTTSMAAAGVPNSQCASITSRPLFISVAESMVILRPIRHVGWLRAASTGTPARASAGGAGTARRTRQDSRAPPRGPAGAGIEDGLCRFRRAAPRRRGAGQAITSGRHHSTSLLASACACRRIARPRLERGRAGRRAQHGVHVVARHQVDQCLGSGAAQIEVGRRAGRQLRPEGFAGGVGGHHRGARPVAIDLQRQRRGAGAGGKADHLQAIGARRQGQCAVPIEPVERGSRGHRGRHRRYRGADCRKTP